jgi:outer membrane protein assembly factor BamB
MRTDSAFLPEKAIGTAKVLHLAVMLLLCAWFVAGAIAGCSSHEGRRDGTHTGTGTAQSQWERYDWSCFRGPRHGVAAWDNAPIKWDGRSGEGVVWKTPLAMSCVSSPVLWRDQLYLTEGSRRERAVMAFDAATGRQLWRQVVEDGGAGKPLPSVSDSALALPTPACDAEGVYAMFGTGDLVSFSHDGKLRWKVFLQRPMLGYGFSSSPSVSDGLVFVQFDDHQDGRVLALEAATGKVVWERERSRGASWSSPILMPGPAGSPIWAANANGSITAFDRKGEVVWDLDGVTGEVAPSPAWSQGRLYLVNVGASLMCYGDGSDPKLLWRYKDYLSNTSSPVVTKGLVFMSAGGGRLVCLDANTGEELWVERGPGAYASLVSSGDRVYCLGRDGAMLIFAAERKFRQIGQCRLFEGSDATPAMADGRMYIRGNRHLWCLGQSTTRPAGQ